MAISNITSSSTTALPSTGGVTPIAPVTGSTSSAPAFQETLTTQNRAFALGLGAPKNHGDIEALFAEIATRFGAEQTTATDFAEAAEDAKRSTSLRAAAGNLGLVAALGAAITAAQDNIAKQNRIIAQKTEQIDALNGQISALEDQYDQYRSEWNDNAETQLSNAGTIFELGLELVGAEIAGDDAEINRINGEIDRLEAQNSTLFNRNLYLDGEMLRISGEIIDLGFQVAGLEVERGWAELSKLGSQAEIGLAEGLLDGLALAFIPFSVDLALRTMGEVGRASFEVTSDQTGLDKAVENSSDNLAEQAARLNAIENARKALEQLPENDPSMRDAINEVLARFGMSSNVDPGTAVDTKGMLDLLSSLRQMIATGLEPEQGSTPAATNEGTGQHSAMEMLRKILADALPQGSGDQQKVVSEAAGLAGGLALLRSILGQVAGGEASMSTQVPGPSGRLSLAL